MPDHTRWLNDSPDARDAEQFGVLYVPDVRQHINKLEGLMGR